MEFNKYKEQQLAEKLRMMSTMNLSKDEFMKSFDKDEISILKKDIEKGMHKYIRKEGDRYIYDEPKEKTNKESKIKVGQIVSIGKTGTKYKVDSIKNDKVKLEQLDEKEETGVMKTQIVDLKRLEDNATIHDKEHTDEEVGLGKKEEVSPKKKISNFFKVKEGSLKIEEDNSIKEKWHDVDVLDFGDKKLLVRHVSPEDNYYTYKIV